MKDSVSQKLMETLHRGKAQTGKEALIRISGFVESQKTADDSFINKSGQPDLYYTLFGWILCYVLRIPLDSRKMKLLLARQDVASFDLIHLAAFVRCRLIHDLVTGGGIRVLLNRFFRAPLTLPKSPGAFPHADPDSPYARFIALSLLEDSGMRAAGKEKIISSLAKYKSQGGGYSNLKNGQFPSTNATNAALAILGQLEGFRQRSDDLIFLQHQQDETGGFRATSSAPVPDLLTTATSLFTLKCYNTAPVHPASGFIDAHWLDSGGFAPTLAEQESDVEYTFYGLLALGAS